RDVPPRLRAPRPARDGTGGTPVVRGDAGTQRHFCDSTIGATLLRSVAKRRRWRVAGVGAVAHAPGAARNRQTSPVARIPPHSSNTGGTGPTVRAGRRHLLLDARRTAVPHGGPGLFFGDRPAEAAAGARAQPGSAGGGVQRRPGGYRPAAAGAESGGL